MIGFALLNGDKLAVGGFELRIFISEHHSFERLITAGC